MKIDWKSSFKIALILTAIASVGAITIALTNVLTEPIIKQNRAQREQNGLKKVFGNDATFGDKVELKEDKYQYLQAFYPVTVNSSSARVYSTKGTNAYGDVALLVGLNADFTIYNIAVMENTESYAITLKENYLDYLMNPKEGKTHEQAFEDTSVKCGATYGAKLVKDMINQAKEHYKEGK